MLGIKRFLNLSRGAIVATSVAAILSTVALAHYLIVPTSYLTNRLHVWQNAQAFDDLDELFKRFDELQKISLKPDQIVEIEGISEIETVDLTAEELSDIASLLRDTAIDYATRQGEYIVSYAGSDSKLGRQFEAHVLQGDDVGASIEQGKLSSCLRVPILGVSEGECLDVIHQDLAILYQWIELNR